jgi:hypothetical protein
MMEIRLYLVSSNVVLHYHLGQVALHFVNSGKISKQAATAIEVCLDDLKSIYEYNTLVKVLSKLIESALIPEIFMMTTIGACIYTPQLKERPQRNAYSLLERVRTLTCSPPSPGDRLRCPGLSIRVRQILARCVERRIWENSKRNQQNFYIWKGFVACIMKYAQEPGAFAAQPCAPSAWCTPLEQNVSAA